MQFNSKCLHRVKRIYNSAYDFNKKTVPKKPLCNDLLGQFHMYKCILLSSIQRSLLTGLPTC